MLRQYEGGIALTQETIDELDNLKLTREACKRLLELRPGIEISSDEWEDIWKECKRYLVSRYN
jgi:hypothetical protein